MTKLKLFVVAHTHFDAEVFVTRDVTLQWGSENILDVLYLLDRDPDYRFVLDQRCYLEGFAGLYPEQMSRLKDHVASRATRDRGRYACDARRQPLPSGESFVRQILWPAVFRESHRD